MVEGEAVQISETWVLKSPITMTITLMDNSPYTINFVSNNVSYTQFGVTVHPMHDILYYSDGTTSTQTYYDGWLNTAYRTLVFESPVDTTTIFGTWLSSNAVKQ